ncbi:aminotransferase class I/II-fold pyridoxal phosphate-dependent enzyme [Allokutzneria sp. A3M-2-11 16]|uniref:trans-sulfuration enzyme family protein n=1 Tax=Allokutzneria sp. A3M-2-11 16 TaxID=2962043 RepID=UPI0020B88B82|nr:aminotransferase class I/II-fold pyridoxal phosphate-dependent enzyme [Allokutzneria sp. A3M-2-11 16]MCP3803355.1 aminotransferase class I/II-fold pyridoxal phosphate-dependent enzyme [Allokutzneria sp. A3M-2-11 16]
MAEHRDATRYVHAGTELPAKPALAPALHQSSVIYARSVREAVDLENMADGVSSYTRVANPTVQRLESAVAELEGGACGLAAPSGMGALTLVFLTLLGPGDRVVAATHSYADTIGVLRELSARIGFELHVIDLSSAAGIDAVHSIRPTMVVTETPSNPMVRVVDLPLLSSVLRPMGARLVVDSTLGTPVNQRPLELGADIVVHSASKYLGGHYSVIGGVLVTDAETAARLHHMRTMTGICMDPHGAWQVLNGLQTLGVRVRRQNGSAQRIAEFLRDREDIEFVAYPGLPEDDSHEVAARTMDGFGGVLAFGVRTDRDGLAAFLDGVRLCTLAVSLGGTKTLIESPALMSHAQGGPDNESLSVIPANAVRLSVGLEDPEDLIDDLAQALDSLAVRSGA